MPRSIPFTPRVRTFSPIWYKINDLEWFDKPFKPRRVPVSELIGCQNSVSTTGVTDARCQYPIYVIRIDGKNYIRDGHHRVMRARLRHQKSIRAFVLDIGE